MRRRADLAGRRAEVEDARLHARDVLRLVPPPQARSRWRKSFELQVSSVWTVDLNTAGQFGGTSGVSDDVY